MTHDMTSMWGILPFPHPDSKDEWDIWKNTAIAIDDAKG
jgi:hypothetical protein